MRFTYSRLRYHVSIEGHLRGRDLRRLEHRCAPALEEATVRLTLRLRPGSSLDPAAQAYVDRLKQRGAEVIAE